ncbi:MAG: DUF3035 domain-containing protein [Acidiphilium sp.]|nr:DUF3035 domain-containing protein [Acidiphilium sp.]
MNRTKQAAPLALIVLAAATLALAGCSDASKTFGLDVTPPDAFSVATEAPLSMPPNLTLAAPQPGAPRPQQISSSKQAEEVLAPQTALANGDSTMGPGQEALLQAAGPTPPAGIRASVNRQAELESRSPGFISSLMSFGGSAKSGNAVLNAGAEQRQLQENAALGAPVNNGPTPVAQPNHPTTLLGRVFSIF